MQEQVSLLVPNQLCRDIIRKYIAPILIRVKPSAIVDVLPVQQFVCLFLNETVLQTLTLHVEETLKTWEPSVNLV